MEDFEKQLKTNSESQWKTLRCGVSIQIRREWLKASLMLRSEKGFFMGWKKPWDGCGVRHPIYPRKKNIILLVFLFLVAQGQKARFLLSISKHTPARTYMYTWNIIDNANRFFSEGGQKVKNSFLRTPLLKHGKHSLITSGCFCDISMLFLRSF